MLHAILYLESTLANYRSTRAGSRYSTSMTWYVEEFKTPHFSAPVPQVLWSLGALASYKVGIILCS